MQARYPIRSLYSAEAILLLIRPWISSSVYSAKHARNRSPLNFSNTVSKSYFAVSDMLSYSSLIIFYFCSYLSLSLKISNIQILFDDILYTCYYHIKESDTCNFSYVGGNFIIILHITILFWTRVWLIVSGC